MDGMADVRAPEAALAIPRFEDGFVNMREPLGQLAESVVNEMLSAEADRLCKATGSSRSGYRERGLVTCVGTLAPRDPEAAHGQPLPRRRDRALPGGGRGRDVRHRHQHEEGAGGGRRDGHGAAVEGPSERHVRAPGLGCVLSSRSER